MSDVGGGHSVVCQLADLLPDATIDDCLVLAPNDQKDAAPSDAVAERVLEEQVVRAVTVTVAKPHVAIRHVLDDVSVTLHLERDAR